MIISHAYFVEEHFVEACATCHLSERTNFYTWCTHVDNEASETFVLWQRWVGAANDFADVGELSTRCPHLLSGDEPLVAVAFGFCLHRCQVATRAGLGEQLATNNVGTPHGADVFFFRDVGGMSQNCWGNHAKANLEDAEWGSAILALDLVVCALVGIGKPCAAVFRWPSYPAKTVVKPFRLPFLGLVQHFHFGVAAALFKHRNVVGSFAPCELLLDFFALGIGL